MFVARALHVVPDKVELAIEARSYNRSARLNMSARHKDLRSMHFLKLHVANMCLRKLSLVVCCVFPSFLLFVVCFQVFSYCLLCVSSKWLYLKYMVYHVV